MNDNLKSARKYKGYTQEIMAEKLGYKSRSAYANIETGRNTPTVIKAIQIAKILDQSVEYLFKEFEVHEKQTLSKSS